MAEPGTSAIRPDCQQAQPNGKERAEALVPGDPSAAETALYHVLSDDGVSDDFAAQLVRFDAQLAGNGTPTISLAETLPEELRAELKPALDCVRLLHEIRMARGAGQSSDAASAGLACANAVPTTFGRFQLRRELGRGGFGIVFLAFDPLLNRDVALKLPRPDCLFTAELRRRFLHEGRAAAGLEHTNIVSVHEAGEIGGVCYLATSYCRGPTLAEWLKQRTAPVLPVDAARLIADIADGIGHAHDRRSEE